jgi:hypothetical protein
MKYVITVVLLAVIFSCSVTKNSERVSLTDVLQKEFGEANYVKIDNETKEFVLCYTKTMNPLTSYGTVKYIVIERTDTKIVKRGTVPDGYIKWIDKYALELFEVPGAIAGDETTDQFKSIIHVKILPN